MARTGTSPALGDLTPTLFASEQVRDNGKGFKSVWLSKIPNGRADDRFRFTTTLQPYGSLEDVEMSALPLVKFAPQSFPGEHPNMSIEMHDAMLGFFQTLDDNIQKMIESHREMWGLPQHFTYFPLVKPPKEEKYKPLVQIKIQDPSVMEDERKHLATNVFMVQNGKVTPVTFDKISKDARCMVVAEIASMWFNPRRAEVGAKIVAQEIMVWPSSTGLKRGLEAFPFTIEPKVAKVEEDTKPNVTGEEEEDVTKVEAKVEEATE